MDFNELISLFEKFGISSDKVVDSFKGGGNPNNILDILRARVLYFTDDYLSDDLEKLITFRVKDFKINEDNEIEVEEPYTPFSVMDWHINILSALDCMTCREVCSQKREVRAC